MKYAILMPHGVDLLRCLERVRSAQNTEESTSCTLSTTIEPDSRGTSPGMTVMPERSSRADLAEELRNLAAELLALRLQRLGSAFDVVGGSRGGVGIGLHAGDVFRDVPGTLRGILRAARDLLRRGALFLHGRGNRGGDFVD